MQFKTAAVAAMTLLVGFAAAVPNDITLRDVGVTDSEFDELYCCGLGRRGDHNTRCCRRSMDDVLAGRSDESELYCCGLGKRGEFNTRCC